MSLADAEEEAPLKISLVLVVRPWCVRSRHNHLNLGQREARLLKVGSVLAQNHLSLVIVSLVSIKKCIRDDRVVFLPSWLLFLVLVSWSRSYDDILVITCPLDIHNVQVRVLQYRAVNRQETLRVDYAEQESFLSRDQALSSAWSLADTVDVASLLDLHRVCYYCLIFTEIHNINVAKNLAYNKDIIAAKEQRCDIRLLY